MKGRARRDQLRAFWRLIGVGAVAEDAARRVGFEGSTGRRWFVQAGGMAPLSLVEPPRGRTLNIVEREQILAGIEAGESIRRIAGRLGRAPSTVSRELRANLWHQDYGRRNRRGPGRKVAHWRYSPHLAQLRADKQKARPKSAKLAAEPRLHAEVQAQLEKNHSPQQIAHRLVIDFPDELEMRVSHETIYRSLYVQGQGALKRELTRHLRTGRVLRKPRRRVGERRGGIPNLVSISERPPEVEDRAVPGHWEGDLIEGSQASGSAIGTLVERATGLVLLLHLPDGHGAVAVQHAMIEAMAQLPETLRQTLTWDRGREMRNHVEIAKATGLAIYFCDPHSPWQRGSNENTNGLLRQYFPKGTDLSIWGPRFLQRVAAELNNRPRKRLDWRTPAEALDQLLSNPTEPPTVALTG
jgi:transposase, IS30 family